MSKPSPSQPSEDEIQNPKFSSSTLDFLLIELVPLAQRITEQVHALEQALIDEYKRSKIFNDTNNAPNGIRSSSQGGSTAVTAATMGKDGTAGEVVTSLGFPAASDETKEAMFWRLDGLGYRVGQGLVER